MASPTFVRHPFEPDMIVNELENLRLRIEAIEPHPRYTDAGNHIAQAMQAVRDARAELHQRETKARMKDQYRGAY